MCECIVCISSTEPSFCWRISFSLCFPFCICFSLALSGEYDCLPLRFSGVDRLVWCEMPGEPWKGQRPTATHRRRNVNENIRWALFSADSRDSCGRIWILWWLARRIQSRLRSIGSNDKRAQLVCARVVRSSSVFVWQLAILIFLLCLFGFISMWLLFFTGIFAGTNTMDSLSLRNISTAFGTMYISNRAV